jgi:HPt (histidine-containing phosphotransfer) domain-containing protein
MAQGRVFGREVFEMSELLSGLQGWGCDVSGAMERMLGDEEFYMEYLHLTVTDGEFDKLGQALERNDARAAFDAAHTLKGVLSNMGLTPLYDCVSAIVEPLREGRFDDTAEEYARLLVRRAELSALLGE